MYRLVVEVTSQPRWDGVAARWQQPGEQIVLESGDMEEFKRMVLIHQAHCHIVEGDLPNFDQQPTFLQKVVQKVKDVAGVSSGPSFTSLADMKAHDKAEEAAQKEAKAEAEASEKAAAERAAHPAACPDCKQEFKSVAALEKHFKRSGHGKTEADAE